MEISHRPNKAMKDYSEHVFVVGSSRSGTTLVTTLLLSSPIYASYRAETQLLNGCELKYGNLSKQESKKKFLADWLRSRQFRRSGLTQEECKNLVLNKEITTYVRLLSEFMNIVAERQGCERWVDGTPGNALSLDLIAEYFPNARVVHVIRDGRAVALSRAKLGWCGVRTDSFDKALCYSAIKWERSVQTARSAKSFLGRRYYEIQYENLVGDPTQELGKLSEFLRIPEFVYDVKDSVHDGSKESDCSNLHHTNSVFGDMPAGISTQAVSRWQNVLTQTQICAIESTIGDTLTQLGYTHSTFCKPSVHHLINGHWCRFVIGLKNLAKENMRIGRFTHTPLEVDRD